MGMAVVVALVVVLVRRSVPSFVNGLHTRERDMDRAIDGRSRRLEDAGYLKGLVGVVDEADFAGAVGQHDLVVEFVAKRGGHLRSQHGVESLLQDRSLGEREVPLVGVAVVLEVVVRRAEHR